MVAYYGFKIYKNFQDFFTSNEREFSLLSLLAYFSLFIKLIIFSFSLLYQWQVYFFFLFIYLKKLKQTQAFHMFISFCRSSNNKSFIGVHHTNHQHRLHHRHFPKIKSTLSIINWILRTHNSHTITSLPPNKVSLL